MSSRYIISLIPLSLRKATTGFISFVNARGAQDRPNGRTGIDCPATETESISGD